MAKGLLPPVLQRFFRPFRNPYFLVLTLFAFWLVFFDKHDVLTQFRLQRTVNQLEQDKVEYREKIKQAQQDRLDLEQNKEKFAREQYYMKRSDEEVFVIEKE
jgi:cell division protein FtsB